MTDKKTKLKTDAGEKAAGDKIGAIPKVSTAGLAAQNVEFLLQ